MKVHTATFWGLALCTPISFADSATFPSIAPDDIYITNSVTKDIYIYFSANGSDWTEFKVKAGGSQTVSVAGPSDNLQVAIQTEDKKCQVRVETKKRYEIIWDSQQKIYCVRGLTPR